MALARTKRQIHITGSELYHTMSRTLRDYLNDRGVVVSDTPTDNQITITKSHLNDACFRCFQMDK